MPTSYKGAYIIPEGIKQIAGGAFSYCSGLTSVTIPNSVTSIGSYAFFNCDGLTSIKSLATVPPEVGVGTFDNVPKDIPLYVPYGSISAYESADGWNEFSNMEEFQFTIAEVRSFADNTEAGVVGVVNFISGKNMYVQDHTGGILVYTKTTPNCQVGQKITAYGTKVLYGGIAELKNAVIESKETGKLYDIIELEDLSSLIVDSLKYNYFAKRVKVSNLTIVKYDSYNNPTVQDRLGNQALCYRMVLSPTAFPIGTTVTVNAIASWFNGFQFVGNAADIVCQPNITVESSDTIMGTVSGSGIYNMGEYIVLTATPKTGYHFSHWDDGNTDNPRKVEVTENKTYTAYFEKNTYTVSVNYNSVYGTVTAPTLGKYLDEITLTATPNVGYEFVQWSDGVKDNPRTIILTQDIVLTAEFAQLYSGQCGDDLYWAYDEANKTISITGSGNMYDYTKSTQPWLLFQEQITEVTTSNTTSSIGTSAFEGCVRLAKVSLGYGMENIAANAFAECKRLYDIYCYASYPPFAEESSFANYNVYLYIPCENQRDYILDVVWGEFKFIECIGAEPENMGGDSVVINTGSTDVTIIWPTEENADTYSIVIKKDGKVVCTLTFNSEGQLLNIAFAPGREGNHPAQYAEATTNGYRFTVTGLEEGTDYTYDITVKDAVNKTISEHSGEFTTNSATALDNTHSQSPITNCQKILRDGQLLIIRDGKTYNAQGVEL
jgi:hypothetical protein